MTEGQHNSFSRVSMTPPSLARSVALSQNLCPLSLALALTQQTIKQTITGQQPSVMVGTVGGAWYASLSLLLSSLELIDTKVCTP